MRKVAWMILGLAVLWPLSLAAQSEEYDSSRFVRITYVQGDATVERAGNLGSEDATVNLALVEGDKLSVRQGRAEIDFGRKNLLRLDGQSEVELSDLPRSGDVRTRLHLLAGSAYLRINSLDQEKSFEVHTPDASYYILEPGLYRLDVRAGAETQLAVIEGSIEAAGEGGSQLVSGGEQLTASNGQLGAQANPSSDRDDFTAFNDGRDSLGNRAVSKGYLPSDLGDYEGELADNGSWNYEQPYGYVWVPNVTNEDWRPYYYGRWDWYDACGWTWVPEESWGWPVYHYGRWQWRLGLGWYWIPHHAWGPAWVHWYQGADCLGWCPLSWYNYPGVLVDNYFYDRYHGARFPGRNRAMTFVQRDHLQDRHISRSALSRFQAGRLGDIDLQARQPDIRPSINRSGLGGFSSMRNGAQPQIRSYNRTPGLSRSFSPSGAAGRSSLGSSSRASTGQVYSGTPRRSFSSRSASGDRVYPSSPGVTSPERRLSPQRRETPRRYSSNASISRFGATGGFSSQARTFGSGGLREWPSNSIRRSPGTTYRAAPWPPSPYTGDRLESRSGSFYSPRSSYNGGGLSRSYSSPRSYSSSGSSRYSSSGSSSSPRSYSRSGSSSRSSSGSRDSSSQSSSSSHGSGGRGSRGGR